MHGGREIFCSPKGLIRTETMQSEVEVQGLKQKDFPLPESATDDAGRVTLLHLSDKALAADAGCSLLRTHASSGPDLV